MIKIYGREFSLENLKEIVEKSESISECIRGLGFAYDNSKLRKILLKELLINQIDVSHFNSKAWSKNKVKYPKIIKTCPVCQKQFETEQGHPKEKTTCSRSCSNTHFVCLRQTEESITKRSKSLIKFYGVHPDLKRMKIFSKGKNIVIFVKNCPVCGNEFKTCKHKQACCSNKCATLHRITPEYRKKLSNAMQKRIANGTHKGWASRSKIKPSYAEQYIIQLLSELNLKYDREVKVGKWFVDFAQIENKLALEIDGKQHLLPERKESDNKKDKFLVENGWKILRIQWKKITKEFRNELILNITSFFNINSKTVSSV